MKKIRCPICERLLDHVYIDSERYKFRVLATHLYYQHKLPDFLRTECTDRWEVISETLRNEEINRAWIAKQLAG